jgi:hypothetical protein
MDKGSPLPPDLVVAMQWFGLDFGEHLIDMISSRNALNPSYLFFLWIRGLHPTFCMQSNSSHSISHDVLLFFSINLWTSNAPHLLSPQEIPCQWSDWFKCSIIWIWCSCYDWSLKLLSFLIFFKISIWDLNTHKYLHLKLPDPKFYLSQSLRGGGCFPDFGPKIRKHTITPTPRLNFH